MGKISSRLRSKQNPPQPTGTPGVNRIDVVLQRLSNASQLGLVLLAVFGYFYTVLPVYQKSLLDEDIAKKTLELRAMENLLSQTEALLSSREAEFRSLTTRVDELRSTADAARQKLGQAQVEVGRLKGAVESQYSELRPRLLRDFQSLGRSQCGGTIKGDMPFSRCVEQKVLMSPVLAALSPSDRELLAKIVREKEAAIEFASSESRSSIEQKKNLAEQQAKDAQSRCDQMKSVEDYKDKFKKITIDYECNVLVSKSQSERLKVQIDEMYASERVLSPFLAAIVKEFIEHAKGQ